MILEYVSGYKLEFISKPYQEYVPAQYRQNQCQKSILQSQIDDLVEKGVVTHIRAEEAKFVSNVFLRPKPNGKHRMIIDLSDLNLHLQKIHFKMDHLEAALDLTFPGSFFASIDLKDAYYSVPIWVNDQNYLSFQWEDQMYKFCVLPFGLSSAPRVFTKILKPVFASLRQNDITCIGYIDDCLIIADSAEECAQNVQTLQKVLINLGFQINWEKSCVDPSTNITFLGYVINSLEMSVEPTRDKIEKAKRKINKILNANEIKIREVASITGLLVDMCKGVEYGLSHYKALEVDKINALKRVGAAQFEGYMWLSDQAKDDLQWWLDNLDGNSKRIKTKVPSIVLTTDASLLGWGAVMRDKSVGGRWSEIEKEEHINVLEMKAILLGLKSFFKDIKNVDILVKSDNTSAVAYVNKMGGTVSKQCDSMARKIWNFCEKRNIWIIASYIPGTENHEADFCSRNFTDNTEWELNNTIFDDICDRWGTPTIDLFASRTNHKCSTFVSWGIDPEAWEINAFTLNWHNFKFSYIFPPFRLVGRCVRKMILEKARGVIVAPDWPGQVWYSTLLRDKRRARMFFRRDKNNLIPGDNSLIGTPLCSTPIVAVRF